MFGEGAGENCDNSGPKKCINEARARQAACANRKGDANLHAEQGEPPIGFVHRKRRRPAARGANHWAPMGAISDIC